MSGTNMTGAEMNGSPNTASAAPPATPPARVIAIANQKGGVGKTTTTINLATALAAIGKRVLVIDLDPQGNASTGLGIPRTKRALGSYNVLFDGMPLEKAAVVTGVPNLSLITASVDLSGAEIELVAQQRREYRLRESVARSALEYDYVLIDCPPALGLLTLNALVAAHAVMVPLQCEFYALEGLSHLVRTIERVKRTFNPELDIHGVVLTMFDKRNNLSDMVAADVRGFFGEKVYETVIPRNVKVSEAPSHGKPVLIYDMRSTGAQAYINLAGEVLRREKRLVA
ncbi:chromosome partitioning protein [Azospirillum fermentarium]|nr:chromosome partitioning protein [Azospirillum fermentarium]